MRGVDVRSWQAVLSTLVGLALATLIGVGFRLLAMYTIQQRRERENRQINERLRTLIAAYKTLGGSFTGDLAVDPTHLRDLPRRDLRRAGDPAGGPGGGPAGGRDGAGPPAGVSPVPGSTAGPAPGAGSDRARRTRDAVEAALSDIFLLGTEAHVRLAAQAARELAAGRPVHTHELVVALRAFVRSALGLEPLPADVVLPRQGPLRPSGASGAGGRGRGEGGGREEARQAGGGGSGGGGGLGGGLDGGLGAGGRLGAGDASDEDDEDEGHHR
ncbi:hypothetical protein tb265_11520 [Gemmatimonadetes bacterium T265]|nr:hypothetical protein tb265_11520 [Gemmatimonadetes bacterium T265]